MNDLLHPIQIRGLQFYPERAGVATGFHFSQVGDTPEFTF